MTGARVRAAVLVCGLLAVAACGSARRGVPLTGHGEPPTAELQLGQRVFARYCHQCHPGGAGGNYDFRVVWANGDTAELRRVNICQASEIVATNRGLEAR